MKLWRKEFNEEIGEIVHLLEMKKGLNFGSIN
jgi:hypothetical protein